MIAFAWVNSLIFSIAPLIGWSSINFEPSKLSCTVDVMKPDFAYISYIFMTFFFCYLLPLVVIGYFVFKPIINTNVKHQDLRFEMNVRFSAEISHY